MRAEAVCARLLARLDEGGYEMRVHSIFQNAVNFMTGIGLVTLLAHDRYLQPYGIRLAGTLPEASGAWGGRLFLNGGGIFRECGMACVSFHAAKPVDLSIAPGAAPMRRYTDELKTYLCGHLSTGEGCLAALIAEDSIEQNVYARFLSPRLAALRQATVHADEDAAADAAARCAGCGAGLTPSSDDLLAGYLGTLYALGHVPLTRVSRLTAAAAGHTNEISACILERLGEGLVSEPVLALLNAIAANKPICGEMRAVAGIGSTSGSDILTGIYFGLLDGTPYEKQGG